MNIEVSTFQFLKDLKNNNNKEWFNDHKGQYDIAKQNVIEFIESIIKGISKKDPSVKEQTAKSCLFRINRDVRFSNNKQPYKTNFGASITMDGRKSNKAGYYIHIEPATCFVGGGMFMPEPIALNKIRQEIDYNSKEFHKIIKHKNFKESYTDLWLDDSLVNPPKGYDKNHPEIKYIKLKSFVATCDISEKDILKSNSHLICVKHLVHLYPFISFLNQAID